MQHKIISQRTLSCECWPVQAWGLEACQDCDYRGTDECGGKKILKTGKNILGHKIPLPDVSKKRRSS